MKNLFIIRFIYLLFILMNGYIKLNMTLENFLFHTKMFHLSFKSREVNINFITLKTFLFTKKNYLIIPLISINFYIFNLNKKTRFFSLRFRKHSYEITLELPKRQRKKNKQTYLNILDACFPENVLQYWQNVVLQQLSESGAIYKELQFLIKLLAPSINIYRNFWEIKMTLGAIWTCIDQ